MFSEGAGSARSVQNVESRGEGRAGRNWAGGRETIRGRSLQAYPRFAQGWHTLGIIYGNEQKIDQAREAQLKAVRLNPKLLAAYLMLARLDIEAKDWEGAKKAADFADSGRHAEEISGGLHSPGDRALAAEG